jgi:hypothetical protein
LNDRSPVRRLVRGYRDFGFHITMKVAYSKVRGWLCPALALPGPPVYNTTLREVSILFSTAEQSAAELDAVFGVVARRGGLDWELCLCERYPLEPEMARALARYRGTQPWLRIVTTDQSVDKETAARWTVEQSTGQFVALLAPGYKLEAGAIAGLFARLHTDPRADAAALIGRDPGPGSLPSRVPWTDCRLLVQRKSGYLAGFQRHWPLTAPAVAKYLDETGVPTTYMAASECAAPD